MEDQVAVPTTQQIPQRFPGRCVFSSSSVSLCVCVCVSVSVCVCVSVRERQVSALGSLPCVPPPSVTLTYPPRPQAQC